MDFIECDLLCLPSFRKQAVLDTQPFFFFKVAAIDPFFPFATAVLTNKIVLYWFIKICL